MTMKITKQELIEMDACEGGLERFIQQTNNTEEPVEVTSLIGGKNTISDLLWLAGKKLPKDNVVRFACDCALINIELIKPYTDKYDDIVDFLNNPTGHAVRDAAYYAADDADDAAYAIHAVYSAIDAAVAAVAVAAAIDAAHYAAGECEDEVNELLVKLFTVGEK